MPPEQGHSSVDRVGRYSDLVGCVLARLAVGALTSILEPQGAVPQSLTILGGLF